MRKLPNRISFFFSNLKRECVADHEAIVIGDGDVARVWGEAARTCLLVSLCELHDLGKMRRDCAVNSQRR